MAGPETRLKTRFIYLTYFLPLIVLVTAVTISAFIVMPALTINSVGSAAFATAVAALLVWTYGSIWRRAKVELISLFKGGRRVILREGYMDIPVHLFSKGYKLLQRNPKMILYRFQYANIEYISWLVVGFGGDLTAEVTIVLTNGREYHLNSNNIPNRKKFLAKIVQYGNVQIISHTPPKPPT